MNKHFNLWTVSFKNTARVTIVNCVCASPITGLCHGQTVGRWGLSGVFSLHLWEEHPQCVPHSCSGLHQQATAARQTQPDPPAVQTPAAPVQQVRAPLLHLKKGEGQELFGNVSGELHPPIKKLHHSLRFGLGKGGVFRLPHHWRVESFLTPQRNTFQNKWTPRCPPCAELFNSAYVFSVLYLAFQTGFDHQPSSIHSLLPRDLLSLCKLKLRMIQLSK